MKYDHCANIFEHQIQIVTYGSKESFYKPSGEAGSMLTKVNKIVLRITPQHSNLVNNICKNLRSTITCLRQKLNAAN